MHWDTTAEFSFGTGCRRNFAVDEWYWAANFSAPLNVALSAMKGLLSGLLGTDQNSQLGTKCVSCCCTSRMPAHVHINMKHLGYIQCYLKKDESCCIILLFWMPLLLTPKVATLPACCCIYCSLLLTHGNCHQFLVQLEWYLLEWPLEEK